MEVLPPDPWCVSALIVSGAPNDHACRSDSPAKPHAGNPSPPVAVPLRRYWPLWTQPLVVRKVSCRPEGFEAVVNPAPWSCTQAMFHFLGLFADAHGAVAAAKPRTPLSSSNLLSR